MKNLIFALVLFASPAFADDAPPHAAPCQRGQSQIKMGGLDFDELKCALVVFQMRIGNLEGESVGLQAKNALLSSDLAAANKTIDDLTKQLDEAKKANGQSKAP